MIKTTIYNNVRNDFKVKFIATSTNWGTLTTIDAWKTRLAGQLGAGNPFLIKNFKFENNTVSFCLIAKSNFQFDLVSLSLTFVDFLGLKKTNRFLLNNNLLTAFNPTIALPSSLLDLRVNSNQLTSFNPTLPLPSGLQILEIGSNLLTDFNPIIPLPNTLINLNIRQNQITNFNPSLLLPSSLLVLRLNNNLFTSFNPTLPLPNSLQELYLNDNSLTNLNMTHPLPNGLKSLRLDRTNVSTLINFMSIPTSVNNINFFQCKFTLQGYTDSEAWANNLHTVTSGTFELRSNLASATGTNFANIIASKGWTVLT